MAKKREPKSEPKKAKQQDLIEDREIKPLEDLAEEYADVRDRRMALNLEEAGLKGKAIKLMKKLERTHYKYNGVEIDVLEGEESIRVRVTKDSDDQGR